MYFLASQRHCKTILSTIPIDVKFSAVKTKEMQSYSELSLFV